MKPDKIRVYVDGVFDLTHFGHYKLFKQARELGDICESYNSRKICNIW